MLFRNLPAVSVVVLAALLTNCGHKSKSKDSDNKGQLVNAAILGKWVHCEPLGLEELGLKAQAFKVERSFAADGKQTLEGTLFEDTTCSKGYSAESAAADQSLLNASPLFSIIAESLAAFPTKLSATYVAGALDANGIGTFDTQHAEGIDYATYKITGNQLVITDTCDQDDIDSGDCEKITGDSAANRAVDFKNSSTYTKQ